jgi:hypothetical protein
MALYLVLYEDRYESLRGDGEFHYLTAVFLNLESAASYKEAKTDEWCLYHIRPSLIWLDGDTIGCEVPIERFDHINREEVLLMATRKIKQELVKG